MKAELVKREDHWALYNEDGHKIAATIPGCYSKLSIKNCEAIENGYDLDELAKNLYKESLNYHLQHELDYTFGVIDGFQKALELLGDKKYNETDLYKTFLINSTGNNTTLRNFFEQKVLPTFNKTEFDVEIVMECVIGCENLILNGENSLCCGNKKPKLDADSCLILRRIV